MPHVTTTTRLFLTEVATPLGPMTLGATDAGACLCEFNDRRALPAERADLQRIFHTAFEPGTNEHLDLLARELAAYFVGSLRAFTVPLDTPGTPFERAVWSKLLEIPYGSTTSYGAIARDLKKPGAPRAVGRTNGRNRLAIVVPCHRVIDSSGALHGYGGGLERKRWLLDHEASHSGAYLI